ncbi:MAG: DUF6385 domain-containing protein [Bacillota bacterium]|jgi:hypothetical protein
MSTLHESELGYKHYSGQKLRTCADSAATSVIKGCFCEYVASLQTGAETRYSIAYPTEDARTITAFVKNTGGVPVTLFLQNSPNGLDFTDDPRELTLNAGEIGYLIPYIFSKYTRVAVKSAQPGAVYLWLQMQRHVYAQLFG